MIDNLVQLYDNIFKASRTQDLEQLAMEQNLNFKKRETFSSQVTGIKGFKIFAKKGAKRFIGVLSEPAQAFSGTIRFYDYLRTKDLETFPRSIIEIYCEDITVDYFKIEPKSAFSKVKGLFVSEDTIFPDLETFNSNFQISYKVPEATAALSKSALDLMTQFPELSCEAEGNHFVFYGRRKEMKIRNILPTMDFAEDFVQLLCYDQGGEFV